MALRREWTHIPALREIIQYGGLSGKTYALVGLDRYLECSQNGWSKTPDIDDAGNPVDAGVFEAINEAGDRMPFILMETGASILGASPHEGERECFVDPRLLAHMGYTEGLVPPEPKANETKPTGAKRTLPPINTSTSAPTGAT